MGSVSSDGGSDQQSERCGSYSLSADVSESESCSSFSCRRFDGEGCSSSMTSSPRLPTVGGFGFRAPLMLPVIGGKDVVIWDDEKPEKRDPDLSGNSIFFCLFWYFCQIIFLFVAKNVILIFPVPNNCKNEKCKKAKNKNKIK